MEQILLAYGLLKKTVIARMMFYKKTRKQRSIFKRSLTGLNSVSFFLDRLPCQD